MARLKIVYRRSTIGLSESQRKVIASLGLHRLSEVVIHDDTPTIRGMVHKVRHLVSVELVEEQGAEGKV